MNASSKPIEADPRELADWRTCAARSGVLWTTGAGALRDSLEELMTPAQLAEAQRLAREWALKGE